MVNDSLHIICGNCGQDLKELNMATWEYIAAEIDEEYQQRSKYIKNQVQNVFKES